MDYSSQELSVLLKEEKQISTFKNTIFKYGIFMFIFGLARPAARGIHSLINDAFLPSETASLLINEFISVFFLYIIPLITAVILFKPHFYTRKNTKYPGSEYTKRKAITKFPSAFAIAIIVNIITTALVALFIKEDQSISSIITEDKINYTWGYFIYSLITVGIMPPIFEEIIFRGFALSVLRPYGDRFAIIFSSLFFGLIHANIYQFTYASALGLFMGYIYIRTNSLITTMVYHAFVNCNSVILVFLYQRGALFIFDKINGTASFGEGWFFVLMISAVFLIYGIILIGILQFLKAVFKYIISKIKKVHISYLNNDYEGLSTAKKYLYLAIQPGMLFCAAVCIFYIIDNLLN